MMIETAQARGGGCGPVARGRLLQRAMAATVDQAEDLLARKERLGSIVNRDERHVERLQIEIGEQRFSDSRATLKSAFADHKQLRAKGR